MLEVYGNYPFEAYDLYTIFRLQRAVGSTDFVAVGFNPPMKNTSFSEFRRNETFKCAEPMALKYPFLDIFGGLKPTVTKSVEPMALKKALTKLVYKP